MPFTPGLDRLAAMQQNPMGTFSSLRRASPVASQYKKQSQMYGQALRNLSRAARRGNTDAAIESLNLRDAANMQGFTPGGIQRAENEQVAIAGREQALMGAEADMRAATTLDRRNGLGALGRPSAPKSFAEIDAEARNRSTMSGAFGTGALNQALDTKRADSDRRAAISRNMEMPQGLRFREDTPASVVPSSEKFTSNVAPGPAISNPNERPLRRDSITDLGNLMRERKAGQDFNDLTNVSRLRTLRRKTPGY